jgi:hypothetical protein
MLTSFDIFSKLPGNWSFSRDIKNFKDPLSSGIVTGMASFTPVNGGEELHYEEQGIFVTDDGQRYHIKKEYFFEFDIESQNIKKYFAQDGKKLGLFYIFGAKYSGEHQCANDHYAAKYTFPVDDLREFTQIYTVKGPNKDYVSGTRYRQAIT